MIPSNKPLKKCPYCLKDVINLGGHIANQHPSVLAQIEEKAGENPTYAQNQTLLDSVPASLPPYSSQIARLTSENMPMQSINSMLKDKIETMMNIKIMQMLEKGATFEELNRAINPPQTPQINQLEQLAQYNKIISSIKGSSVPIGEVAESSTDWGAIIGSALQLLPTLLAGRNKTNSEVIENVRNGRDEERSPAILKPFQVEVTRDTEQPSSFGDESGKSSDNDE